MSKPINEFNTIMYLSILIAVFSLFIGTSYSYYINVSNKVESQKIIVKRVNMLLKFEEGNEINKKNILPGYKDSYSFSIENFSDDASGKYKIILEIKNPLTDLEDSSFVYSLEGTSLYENNENILVSSFGNIPVKTITLGEANITSRNIHNYVLKIELKDNNKNQNYLEGKDFTAKIKVINNYD